jgi:NAD(P)-dependent dehydrogenase (short-subunit alcohol dehydrogenase family)
VMTESFSSASGLPEDIAEVFRLDGRCAVVTGAASGLGRAIALGFAQFGADVACLDIDLDGARETSGTISDLGRESSAVQTDVREWESVRAAVADARGLTGRVDVAVNVPGINRRKPVLELAPEEFSEVLEVNLKGLFHCSRAFGELMVPNGRGKIINMASVFGLVAMERQAAYAASKGAVVQLTRCSPLNSRRTTSRSTPSLPPTSPPLSSGRSWRTRRGMRRSLVRCRRGGSARCGR